MLITCFSHTSSTITILPFVYVKIHSIASLPSYNLKYNLIVPNFDIVMNANWLYQHCQLNDDMANVLIVM